MFADAGNTYRFSVVVVTNSDTISGYIYFGSYKEFDVQKYGNDIKRYFLEAKSMDSIAIYPFISTYKLGFSDVDFTLKQSKKVVAFKNISTISYSDILEYPMGQRLIELEPKEMELLKLYQPNVQFVYNESYSVMSSFVILSWEKDKDLQEIQKNISKKLIESIPEKESINSENIKPFFDYLDELKTKLFSEGILIFEIHGSC
jgi:hypothetical protein